MKSAVTCIAQEHGVCAICAVAHFAGPVIITCRVRAVLCQPDTSRMIKTSYEDGGTSLLVSRMVNKRDPFG